MNRPDRGHLEKEHTADLQLDVWAPDLAALLEEAARGMYEMMGVEIADESRRHQHIELTADDREGLLVSFLEELLFLVDDEDLAFDAYLITVDGTQLNAHLEGGFVVSHGKEIKAVTYHLLAIEESVRGLEVSIIFDV